MKRERCIWLLDQLRSQAEENLADLFDGSSLRSAAVVVTKHDLAALTATLRALRSLQKESL